MISNVISTIRRNFAKMADGMTRNFAAIQESVTHRNVDMAYLDDEA